MRASKTPTDVRQEQIATAALELMARHGPRSLNVARLAHRVGVAPSAIYRHYRGKDAVLEAVLDLIAQRLRQNVRAVREETPETLERLRRLLARHVELIRKNIAIPRVVLSEEIFSRSPKRRRRTHGIIQEYLDEVAELVGEGQQAGSVRSDLRANTVSVMFLGLIQPAVILWLMSDGVFDVTDHTERAWQIFSQGIQADGSRDLSPSTEITARHITRKEQRR